MNVNEILNEFGIDEADVDWKDFAYCKSIDPRYFDRFYQDTPKLRPIVDDLCLSCPVLKECGIAAVTNRESYVWAGTFFDNGVPVPEMNDHKTEEFKNRLKERIRE
jgi:hypothetical protein